MRTSVTARISLARLRRAGAGVYGALAFSRSGAVRSRTQDAAAWQMLMPEVPVTHEPQALARWRGRVDALSLRARYSDPLRYAARVPQAAAAKTLFSMLEQNRVEALGAARYAGMCNNLAALSHEHWSSARPEAVIRGTDADWVETFALLTRIPMGAPLPDSACRSLRGGWRAWMSTSQAREVAKLAALVNHQDAFAVQSLKVIELVLASEIPASVIDRAAKSSADTTAPAESEAPAPQLSPGSNHGAAPAAGGTRHATPSPSPQPGAYQVYTSAYDTQVNAANLVDAATLAKHRAELDAVVGNRLSKIARWAHRLQRQLLRLQVRSWQFDREEGELDAARLSRVATQPLEPLVFKQETVPHFPETVVTLLVDNSGSMRGVPIATAAVCAELLGRVLERCAIKTEVLGFTTRTWRGGRAHRDWVSAGRPPNPGRIAELRHIIYKNAEEPWRRAGVRMGAMLADDLLRENIDGEALSWACQRLRARREPRKILIVVSDGAPLDDATLASNDRAYLERHLRSVIAGIEGRCDIELAAIGIGHDVKAYYRRAVTLRSADELGEAIVTQLISLFDARGRGT